MDKIYLCGDIHGSAQPIIDFYNSNMYNIDENCMIILLGDTGLNFFLDERDTKLKQKLSKLPFTYFIIRGNHDCRISTARQVRQFESCSFVGGTVYREKDFPNILYATDNVSYYYFNKYKVLVLPGGYSVDAPDRRMYGLTWYPDEILNSEELKQAYQLSQSPTPPQIILSHVAPANLVPTDLFLKSINQATVDHSMENMFEKISRNTNYQLWCWAHYHEYRNYPIEKDNKHHIMLYNDYLINLQDVIDNPQSFNLY